VSGRDSRRKGREGEDEMGADKIIVVMSMDQFGLYNIGSPAGY
jgi:hypothetical protein